MTAVPPTNPTTNPRDDYTRASAAEKYAHARLLNAQAALLEQQLQERAAATLSDPDDTP